MPVPKSIIERLHIEPTAQSDETVSITHGVVNVKHRDVLNAHSRGRSGLSPFHVAPTTCGPRVTRARESDAVAVWAL